MVSNYKSSTNNKPKVKKKEISRSALSGKGASFRSAPTNARKRPKKKINFLTLLLKDAKPTGNVVNSIICLIVLARSPMNYMRI